MDRWWMEMGEIDWIGRGLVEWGWRWNKWRWLGLVTPTHHCHSHCAIYGWISGLAFAYKFPASSLFLLFFSPLSFLLVISTAGHFICTECSYCLSLNWWYTNLDQWIYSMKEIKYPFNILITAEEIYIGTVLLLFWHIGLELWMVDSTQEIRNLIKILHASHQQLIRSFLYHFHSFDLWRYLQNRLYIFFLSQRPWWRTTKRIVGVGGLA